jgi:hypothetical protein
MCVRFFLNKWKLAITCFLLVLLRKLCEGSLGNVLVQQFAPENFGKQFVGLSFLTRWEKVLYGWCVGCSLGN